MRRAVLPAMCCMFALCASAASAVEYGYYEYHAENPLNGISGTSTTSLWAVGDGGFVAHYDGSSWSPEESGTTADLVSVAAVDAARAYAIGGEALYAGGASGWEKVADIPGASKVEALPDGRAWILGTAGIYRYEGIGVPALLPIALGDGRTIVEFSLIGATGDLWLATNGFESDVFAYLSGALEARGSISGYYGVPGVRLLAVDGAHAWATSRSSVSASVTFYGVDYFDGSAWGTVPSGDAYVDGLGRDASGSVYVAGVGLYAAAASGLTPAGDSLLALNGVCAPPGGGVWCVDDYSILHYGDWPENTTPVGCKIANDADVVYSVTPSGAGYYVSIQAVACLQPTDRVVDVYVAAWDPSGAIHSVLPGNRLADGVQPYARGIGPVGEQLFHAVYTLNDLFMREPPSGYRVGIGLMPAGQPPTWAGLAGSYVGPLCTQSIPLHLP